MKPIIKIIQDTRRAKNNSDRYPIKLRVTVAKQQKYYPTGLYLTVEEFYHVQNEAANNRNYGTLQKRQIKEWKLTCESITVKANKISMELPEFSFRLFESKYQNKTEIIHDVCDLYIETVRRFINNSKFGTSSNYQCSLNSLKQFSPKLSFKDIDVNFLKDYEKWLISAGKSISTVGIYLRPLRAVFNEAISIGMVNKDKYPFGKRKYQIPASRNLKKALTKAELSSIFKYECIPGTWYEKAKDFFLLSYLCNGMNIKDIALLKYENLEGEYIYFIRSKTEDTNRSFSAPISAFIGPEAQSIINRQKSPLTSPKDYLFPILEKDLTPEKQFKTIKQFIKMVNLYIKKIAVSLEITKPITTYYARHSFATMLKREGAPTEFISDSLGHSNLMTTKSYLDSFENDAKKEWSKVLTNFKNS